MIDLVAVSDPSGRPVISSLGLCECALIQELLGGVVRMSDFVIDMEAEARRVTHS